ncbi:hypothetical protein Nepgr_023970 [Nepenthes gracilis]|uniref:Uncharacterized protein n=1 Tax=Nepenthes gracilis TaxID=150966 RepID=A0AAD3T4Y5_NEPGR|nr:hypothetical protein Nepgr_023970 [Nepenthes gracilis]
MTANGGCDVRCTMHIHLDFVFGQCGAPAKVMCWCARPLLWWCSRMDRVFGAGGCSSCPVVQRQAGPARPQVNAQCCLRCTARCSVMLDCVLWDEVAGAELLFNSWLRLVVVLKIDAAIDAEIADEDLIDEGFLLFG